MLLQLLCQSISVISPKPLKTALNTLQAIFWEDSPSLNLLLLRLLIQNYTANLSNSVTFILTFICSVFFREVTFHLNLLITVVYKSQ